MLTNYLILIISIEKPGLVCDAVGQTVRILSSKNKVIIFEPDSKISVLKLMKRLIFHRSPFHHRQQVLVFNQALVIPDLIIKISLKLSRQLDELLKNLNIVISAVLLFMLLYPTFQRSKRNILWISFPQYSYLVQLFRLLPNCVFLYDIFDEQSSSDNTKRQRLAKAKTKLLQQADVVTTISHAMRSRYQQLHRSASIEVVPQGFALCSFVSQSGKKQELSQPQWQKNYPTIGFVGRISDRFDYKLLNDLASSNPLWQFLLVGPIQLEGNVDRPDRLVEVRKLLIKLPNLIHISSQPRTALPSIIEQFDICMIPYNVSLDFNRYCYPMKLFEYFYMGKPVVSTPIEELTRPEFAEFIKIGATARDWQRHIEQLLAKPWPSKLQKRQRQLAIANSWQRKVEAISGIIQRYDSQHRG